MIEITTGSMQVLLKVGVFAKHVILPACSLLLIQFNVINNVSIIEIVDANL